MSDIGTHNGRKRPLRYAGNSAELHTVSSTFTDDATDSIDPSSPAYNERLDGTVFQLDGAAGADTSWRKKRAKRNHDSLPFLKVVHSNMSFREKGAYTANEKLQHVGELIVCR